VQDKTTNIEMKMLDNHTKYLSFDIVPIKRHDIVLKII